MNLLSDPRFLYMLSVLPILLGLTLVGDGISKLVHEKQGGPASPSQGGWVSIATGVALLLIAGLIIVTSNK